MVTCNIEILSAFVVVTNMFNFALVHDYTSDDMLQTVFMLWLVYRLFVGYVG